MSRVTARPARLEILVLAVLAYLPALASSPGRMPADTKLYLYTDPGGLLGRAASTFEPDQFAGWVPHQQITYLWPSGPWFWLFDAIAVPDWIAHRLWIGTIMFAAGMGVRQCVRLLGHSGAAILAAAVVYQLSPLLLPYISRTSLLLLPWAGLGWIVAATIRATQTEQAQVSLIERWREPAIIALIVATVGSGNATALAMIVPAPAIWLLFCASRSAMPLGDLVRITVRVGVSCVAVSVWWITMLIVQSRSGAPVLLYSETLEDVSRNSTGPEVLRGLGYWLFYGRDAFAATTTSSLGYLTRTSGIVISFTLPILGLTGIAFGRSEHRRFAAALTFVGMVLAVGVHPLGDSSLLVELLTGDDDTGLALALRSSTRALPVMVLGLALGTSALVQRVPSNACGSLRPDIMTWRRLAAVSVVFVAVANMPTLWKAQLVDPAIDRDSELPTAWAEAAARLDSDPDDTRVLQLPGAEFGAFDWGYTVDPPLVSATDRGVITRDLLPLGSPAAMDLLYAFDDRIQNGVLEPQAVAPISRLLAVGTIWLANDTDSLRFRTTPPVALDALLTDAPGVEDAGSFGSPVAEATAFDLFGRPLVDADTIGLTTAMSERVSLRDIEDPLEVSRVKTDEIIVSGSGEGVIDAAAAGLIDGSELIRYGTDVDSIAATDRVVVTDSNRDRARHWRSSQDVTGHTEPGGPSDDVLVATAADQRLDPLGTGADSDAQTIAVQRGPVTATASSSGEPFAYRPEDRAVMAIDGDPDTAWSVGDHGDPIGAVLRLEPDETVDTLLLHQIPPLPGGRHIASIEVRTDDSTQSVSLETPSINGSGQSVVLDDPTQGTIDIVITSVTTGDPAVARSRAGVGFVEVDSGLGMTTEFIRPPVDTLQRLPADHGPLDIVLTRERVDATTFWRSDPEPMFRRLLPLPLDDTFDVEVTVRLDARSTDAQIAGIIGDEGAIANRRLPGLAHRGSAAVDGDSTTTWLTPIDEAVGSTLTVTSTSDPVSALDIVQPVGTWSTISEFVVTGAGGEALVGVPVPDANGRSSVPVPPGLVPAGTSFTLTVSRIEPRLVAERRYGDVITMPAGIAELTGTVGITASAPASDRSVTGACDASMLAVDGAPLRIEFSALAGALLAGLPITASPCDGPLALDRGEHTIVDQATGTGFTVDRVVLTASDGALDEMNGDPTPTPVAEVSTTEQGTRNRTVEIDCPDGCWLVFGMGHNTAWNAEGPSGDLGAPTLVDGGFNGWWIEPTTGTATVSIRWTAQRLVTIGTIISVLAVLAGCAVLLVARVRRRASATSAPDAGVASGTRWPGGVVPLFVVAGAVAATVTPFWGVVVLAAGGCELLARRRWRPIPVTAVLGLAAAVWVGVSVTAIERRDSPFPDAGWTVAFDHLNGLALVAVALVATSTVISSQNSRNGSPTRPSQ